MSSHGKRRGGAIFIYLVLYREIKICLVEHPP